MSDSSTNPFVLPGMGQSGDLSGNPLLASMEMMRQAWAGLAGPGGLIQSVPMAPPMNIEELERRIAELRSVESWLRMNLSMLSSAIQGMEVQRATIATLKSFVDTASFKQKAGDADGAPSPLEVVLGLKPAPASKTDTAAKPAEAASATAASDEAGHSQAAPQAWWDMLQQQFNTIATATAASMAGMAQQAAAASAEAADAASATTAAAAPQPSPKAESAKPARKTTARKRAAPAKRARKSTVSKPPADPS